MRGNQSSLSTGRTTALYRPGYGNAAIRTLTAGSWAFLTEPPVGFAENGKRVEPE